ncbi:unnamed protein product, partial [Vicia faba]
ISDLGMMHYFLGIEAVQSNAEIFLCQKKYVLDVLDRFQMKHCNVVNTPVEVSLQLSKDSGGKEVDNIFYKRIVGSLMYLTTTQSDIIHVVSLISRYIERPRQTHLLTAKRILRYLQGTKNFGLFYKKGERTDLCGFSDSDYARDVDDRKSITRLFAGNFDQDNKGIIHLNFHKMA